jgi:hypothetical protein
MPAPRILKEVSGMSLFDIEVLPEPQPARPAHHIRFRRGVIPPRRTAPFDVEPGYFEPAGLWFSGNFRLLDGRLAHVPGASGPNQHRPRELDAIEKETEELVLDGKVLVCGIHSYAHQRSAIVPLRWGAPRIVVLSGGFKYHLGDDLKDELFRAARLWRYQFDPKTDLVVSRRAPDKKPTYASHNPTVDRLITMLAERDWVGLRTPEELLCSIHAKPH